MKVLQQERKPGIYGLAQVQATKAKIKVTMLAKGKHHKAGQVFTFEPESVNATVRTGKYQVALSGDGKMVFGCYPDTGSFEVRFAGFIARKGQPPIPMRQVGQRRSKKDGKIYPYDEMVCRATLEIVSGPDKGMTIPASLRYDRLIEDEEGFVAIAGSSKPAQLLGDFLGVCGVYDQQIEFEENLLPTLEDMILERKQKFQVVMKAGWPTAFAPLTKTGRSVAGVRKVRRS